jgi:hypothetical protein
MASQPNHQNFFFCKRRVPAAAGEHLADTIRVEVRLSSRMARCPRAAPHIAVYETLLP